MKPLNFVSADEAVSHIPSHCHVHLSSVASVPHILIQALCRRADAGDVRDLHFHHFHTEGPAPYSEPRYEGIFFEQGFFVGPNVRANVNAGYADYLPVHLGESQKLYREGMTLVKSTPVASFIILALIWIGRGILPAFISGLMVLPVVWANVSAGIAAQDPHLLELAQVYGFPRVRVFRRITVPTVLPYFRSALSSALGLGWKAGIAAEVLTVPQNSIGKMIYESKLYLETTSLFAWTLAVILLSLVIERILLRFIRQGSRKDGSKHA